MKTPGFEGFKKSRESRLQSSAQPVATVFSPQRARCRSRSTLFAYSLIELVGVLAIIAILAAVLLPKVIKQIDRAAWLRESADLGDITNSVVLSILRDKRIPDTASFPISAASQMNMPTSAITNTPRGITRYYLINPNFSVGTNSGGGYLYTQTTNGTQRPTGATLMLVSTIAKSLLSADLVSANFSNMWNTAEGQKPSSWTWSGSGDDLRFQRINVEPLFHQLILVNRDSNNAAMFTIDGSDPVLVPANGLGWNSYYLDGTVLGLNSNDVVQTKYILKQDISFVFDGGLWLGQLAAGNNSTNSAASFAQTAAQFFGTNWNAHAIQQGGKGGSQSAVLASMYNFMLDWVMWGNQCPNFNHFGQSINNNRAQSQLPVWQTIDDEAHLHLDAYSGSGTWGLLH